MINLLRFLQKIFFKPFQFPNNDQQLSCRNNFLDDYFINKRIQNRFNVIKGDRDRLASEQAKEAAKKAADLKDRIGDAKSLTDAFNPDAKFKAFAGALQGVAGGFSFVTGAMGTLGVKSDEVEKMLLKVNSAMAMVQGLNALGESVDAFKILGGYIKSSKIFQDTYTFYLKNNLNYSIFLIV